MGGKLEVLGVGMGIFRRMAARAIALCIAERHPVMEMMGTQRRCELGLYDTLIGQQRAN